MVVFVVFVAFFKISKIEKLKNFDFLIFKNKSIYGNISKKSNFSTFFFILVHPFQKWTFIFVHFPKKFSIV